MNQMIAVTLSDTVERRFRCRIWKSVRQRRRRRRLPVAEVVFKSDRQSSDSLPFPNQTERHHQRIQGVSADNSGRMPAFSFASFQFDCRTAIEVHRTRLFMDSHSYHLAKSPHWTGETKSPRDGKSLLLHRCIRLARKILQSRRLREVREVLNADLRWPLRFARIDSLRKMKRASR